MSTELFIGDPSFKDPILVSSLPAAPDLYNYATGTIAANNQLNILWTAQPNRPQLSLWNFAFTLRFGADDAAHEWPQGASLTSNQIFCDVSLVSDVLLSDDLTNKKYNKLVIRNNTASTWPFYLYFKAYTFSTSVGVNT